MTTPFIGITIGPIYDTIMLTSTPAGLWASSFLFSELAREIIVRLAESVSQDDFVTPMVEIEDGKLKPLKYDGINLSGIGMYHDHIIYRGCGIENANRAVNEAIECVSNKLSDGKDTNYRDYFRRYFSVHTIKCEVDDLQSPISKFAKPLDALELQKNFIRVETENPLLSILDSRDEQGHNDNIIKMFLPNIYGNDKSDWQLYDSENHHIKNIKEIACGTSEPAEPMKYTSYYAIVKADGDNMGATLNGLTKPAQWRAFSQACFNYAARSSKLIKDSGGVTIYAGGDDLMFISPLIYNGDKNVIKAEKTIIDLLCNIREIFKCEFKHYIDAEAVKKPAVSFGVSINYYKFPLYEAFAEVDGLLSGKAKSGDKNAAAIQLTKHSGQRIGFRIGNFDRSHDIDGINDLFGEKNSDEFLSSVLHKTGEFYRLINIPLEKKDKNTLKHLFKNIFDDEIHKNNGYIDKVRDFLYETKDITPLDRPEHNTDKNDKIAMTEYILRFVKFFTEKGEESETDENNSH